MSSPPVVPQDFQVKTFKVQPGVIYQWDALHLLRAIPDRSIDVIWSSPPYNLADPFRPGRPKKPGRPLKKHRYADSPGRGDGWHMPEADYQRQQIEVLNEWARVLKKDGVAFYSHNPRTVNWALEHPLKWIYQSQIVPLQEIVWWHGPSQNRQRQRFGFEHETIIVCGVTPGPKLVNSERRGDVWYIPRDGKARQQWDHPATAHPTVVRHCLAAVPEPAGKMVLDCYAGVGTTAVIAQDLDYEWIIGDISMTYCRKAQARLSATLF